jgi:mono/diheme cytochrome c family protein
MRKLRLPRDLRDVVVDGARLLVSRFRSAELLVVEQDGTVSRTLTPPPIPEPPPTGPSGTMQPAVAWRTVAAPGGGALMVHHYIVRGPISAEVGGYGGRCRRILTSAVTWLRPDGAGWTVDAIPVVLPVDVATTGDGTRVAVPSAGRTSFFNPGPFNPVPMPFAVFTPPASGRQALSPCGGGIAIAPLPDGIPAPQGRVVAVAFDALGRLALQTREPAVFHLGSRSVALPGLSRKHTGHELFHLATASGIACASCHPDGQDDGQVWNFAALGPRRTQSLGGGILGTEPFHWGGDMRDFNMLAADVFSQRMSGPAVQPEHTASLMNWVDKIPRLAPPAATDEEAAARGQTLFNDPVVGCASCHSGPRRTNNATVSVNTGGSFQVPSLTGIAWRAPYMHQGCAATLEDRFGPCGGGDAHGKTSQLTTAQLADLVAYVETL